MDKAKADKKDPYISLLEYRNTPVDGFRSPAQLLMSRRLRSILPTTSQQLQPETVSGNDVHARREQKQQHQAKYYNRSAKPLTPLRDGDHVRIQESGKWKPAVVIKPADTYRSYHVSTAGGQIFRRNRRHLLPDRAQPTTAEPGMSSSIQHTVPMDQPQQTDTKKTDSVAPLYVTRSGREVKPRAVLDL
jgi:hypothetical protein